MGFTETSENTIKGSLMKKEGRWGGIICTLINHASLCYLNVSSRLIETLTSLSIKKESFKFARPWIFTTVCWIMQWSVNYSSLPDRDGCALKSMQKRGNQTWCCVNTFQSGLLTRQILFQHWFRLFWCLLLIRYVLQINFGWRASVPDGRCYLLEKVSPGLLHGLLKETPHSKDDSLMEMAQSVMNGGCMEALLKNNSHVVMSAKVQSNKR